MSGCSIASDAGAVRAVLGAVDCNTRDFAQRGYETLTGAGSPFQAALTILLTIYVAFVGYRLLFAPDGARLSDAPRMALKVGAILALVTSWSVFQTLVFDVAAKAPVEIAALISTPGADGLGRNADPIGRLQVAYDQLSIEAVRYGKAAGPATAANASREAAAAKALSAASGTLLMANAGLIAVAKVAIGVLTAIGPIFIALFLFLETRGLFVGWVRALTAAALASLSAWTLAVLMLSVEEPWLVALARQRELNVLDPQTAVSAASMVFVFAAGQIGLVLAGAVVSLGLRLPVGRRSAAPAQASAAEGPSAVPAELVSRPAQLAEQLQRLELMVSRASRASEMVTSSSAAMARDQRGSAPIPPERIGDLYRRPAVRGRAGAAA